MRSDDPRPAFHPALEDGGTAGSGSLEALLDVANPLIVEIGRTRMTVQEIMQLGIGSVVQLERSVGERTDGPG